MDTCHYGLLPRVFTPTSACLMSLTDKDILCSLVAHINGVSLLIFFRLNLIQKRQLVLKYTFQQALSEVASM